MPQPTDLMRSIDEELSKRPLTLDPNGYFILYIDREGGFICAKYFTNLINDQGLAVDPETGKVIPAKGNTGRVSSIMYQGRTAKELCVEIFERSQQMPISLLDHAAYLGRESQRAEWALISGEEYIQD